MTTWMNRAKIPVRYSGGFSRTQEASTRQDVQRNCHGDESSHVQYGGSDGREWKLHLVEGRAAEKVWTYVSELKAGSTCGW